METQTTGTHNLIRGAILVAIGALLALSSIQRASANQSGDPVGNSTAQAQVCRALGGTPTVDVERTVGSGVVGIWTKCTGGLLDGLECSNKPSGTMCWFGFVRPGEDVTVPTTGEVEQIDVAPEPTPDTVDERVEPEPAEDPADDAEPADPVEEPSVDKPEIIDEVVQPDPVDEPAPDDTPVLDDIVAEPGPIEEPALDEPLVIDPNIVVGLPDTTEDPVVVSP